MREGATNAIWWIRRDLRLHDNPALQAALEGGRSVVPLFILDPRLLDSPYVGPRRAGFLFAALRSLDRGLAQLGASLVIRRGEPLAVLRQVAQEAKAERIYAQPDHSPYARKRDSRVGAELVIRWIGDPAIRPPGSVLKADGDPYVVYSPFRNRWGEAPPQEADLLPAPASLPGTPALASTSIPSAPGDDELIDFPATERAARERLASFTHEDGGIHRYQEVRDRLGADGTSRLSPYLRFGLLSGREAYVAGGQALTNSGPADASAGPRSWLDELIWRDFYLHILHFFPEARQRSFRSKYEQIQWRNRAGDFEAWRQGQTGYPVVDAGMRQLAATGWMHNRARMIVGSFLVKDLLIDWRWGERHFMLQLLDGDPAANNGGWQWVAGTGTDAAPYFRIFNPVTQGEKHDSDGTYVRRWVPELAEVPDRYLHKPWKMSANEQEESSCRIGQDYPGPLVDHAQARERALAAYRAVG